jgi:hypothetical protein
MPSRLLKQEPLLTEETFVEVDRQSLTPEALILTMDLGAASNKVAFPQLRACLTGVHKVAFPRPPRPGVAL